MEAVTIRNGRPYVLCPVCKGSDAPEHNLCPECFGAGWAPVFEPERFAFARFQGHAAAPKDATFSNGNGGGKGSATFTNKFAGKCDTCGQWVEAGAGKCARDGQRWIVLHNGECPAPVAKPAKPAPAVTVLDLTSLPSGHYAISGGDTRLKLRIDNVKQGKWAGWVFVKDGAEYGQGQRYGSQRPGGLYQGKVSDALAAILNDPKAAVAAYGHLTGTCGVCGHHLEDADSIARGIGPVCNKKF